MAWTPVRPLAWLLRAVTSRDAATAAIGDACETLAEQRAAGLGPRWPALWLNLQVARAVGSEMLAGAPRFVRAGGLILRDAVRALRAAPTHTLFIVLVLAVGVTTGTVTFSVVDAVMLKPLPLDHPERVVGISTGERIIRPRITPDVYWRLHDRMASVESIAPRSTMFGSPVTVGTLTDEWPVIRTSADIFRVLRLSPAIGRLWTADDEAQGETDVAVLGYRFWRRELQGDPSVLGTIVSFGSSQRRWSYRVIGVLSEASDHPDVDLPSTPIWIPMNLPRTDEPNHLFAIIARMRPGVSTAQVADEVQKLAGTPDWRPTVTPLLDGYVSRVRGWLLLALGAAALVVLIACVNVANLMLTRSTRRAHELAIRASLGASRRRVALSVLAEGLLLSVGATVCAVLLATGGARVMRNVITSMPLGVFRASTIAVNGRVLAAALASAVVTGVLFSLVPAWQASRAQLVGLLKDADAGGTTGRRRWRSIFLSSEVAIVTVLLVVSWLFVTSLVRVTSIDLGIDRTNLVAVNSRVEFQGTVDDVAGRIRRVPGVADVAVSRGASLPLVGRAFGGAWGTREIEPMGGPPGSAARAPVTALDYRVTANYFDVAGLRFGRGTTWSADAASAASSVVLDEKAAAQLFGAADPVGRLVKAKDPEGVFTVVGVVPHVYARGPEEDDPPCAYFALKPDPARSYANMFVRTTRPPDQMVVAITEALKPVAPQQKDPYVFVADDAVGVITAQRRFNTALMSVFGLVGVLIGAAGVYAVMASFVAQQTHEIGVRVALGATPARIQQNVLRLAARHLLAGLAVGLPAAWWLSRGFTALLFQVTPADVPVYVGVSLLLGAVAVVAAWAPARRAARIDPIVTLRRG